MSSTPQPSYSWGTTLITIWTEDCVGLNIGLLDEQKRRMSWACTESKPIQRYSKAAIQCHTHWANLASPSQGTITSTTAVLSVRNNDHPSHLCLLLTLGRADKLWLLQVRYFSLIQYLSIAQGRKILPMRSFNTEREQHFIHELRHFLSASDKALVKDSRLVHSQTQLAKWSFHYSDILFSTVKI